MISNTTAPPVAGGRAREVAECRSSKNHSVEWIIFKQASARFWERAVALNYQPVISSIHL